MPTMISSTTFSALTALPEEISSAEVIEAFKETSKKIAGIPTRRALQGTDQEEPVTIKTTAEGMNCTKIVDETGIDVANKKCYNVMVKFTSKNSSGIDVSEAGKKNEDALSTGVFASMLEEDHNIVATVILPPSDEPSSFPSSTPNTSFEPSSNPSDVPSFEPSSSNAPSTSAVPSLVPTITNTPTISPAPSSVPSLSPTSSPTASPSVDPSVSPSYNPSLSPSDVPSSFPSGGPSGSPSPAPSASPSSSPSNSPSSDPSYAPSSAPSGGPSASPSASPSGSPSSAPSDRPSESPSSSPSVSPSASPSSSPSESPSSDPRSAPSSAPSSSPSFSPSASPSGSPSESPSYAPSGSPSESPSSAPSASPSDSLSSAPSTSPSESPSYAPSGSPSESPSSAPSASPSERPTSAPSTSPSESPSSAPSTSPSESPSSAPSTSCSALSPAPSASSAISGCGSESVRQKDYRGTIAKTVSGRVCQRWDAQYPHVHSDNAKRYPNADLENNNYCRNPNANIYNRKAWCYTTDPNVRKERCAVPSCPTLCCGSESVKQTDYRGTIAKTLSGRVCQRWDAQSPHVHSDNAEKYPNADLENNNYCRNPNAPDSHEAWCYTTDPEVRKERCAVPYCAPTLGCGSDSVKQTDYRGTIAKTVSGLVCQRWDAQYPHQHVNNAEKHPDADLEDNNYCRNPNGSSEAWCYTTDPEVRFERCAVPTCSTGCGSENVRQQDYRGTLAKTVSGRVCQRWDAQSPHSHGINYDHHNYCRNPNPWDFSSHEAWCYTTDPQVRFESCAVPYCSESPSSAPSCSAISSQSKLTASDGAAKDNFGFSVAISGDKIVVGAYRDDDNYSNSGSVYVFENAGSTCTTETKLTASDGAAWDFFGYSVAISGDTIVVGAYSDDDNDNGSNSGSVYVFETDGNNWEQKAKLTASDGAVGDYFGWSVAISEDTIVVGARADGDGSFSGSVYVFEKKNSIWLNEGTKLTASDGAAYDQFGRSVAISVDTIVVGASYDDNDKGSNSGSAYLFQKVGSTWKQEAKFTAFDGAANDSFGNSVIISEDTIVVGAYRDDDNGSSSGSIYVFEKVNSIWSKNGTKLTASDPAANDRFGYSVAISGDKIVVGAQGNDDNGSSSGSVYVFEKDSSTWKHKDKLTASDGAAWDEFGYSVAISEETIVVGAIYDDANGPSSGSAYVFKSPTPSPTLI